MTRRSLFLLSPVLLVSSCQSAFVNHQECSFRATKKMSSLDAAKAGSFFNEVPSNKDDDDTQDELKDILDQHRQPSRASQPSTINGVPSSQAGVGFGTITSKTTKLEVKTGQNYVGIGQPKLNDVTKPEYDDQGYTLYADETTGTKSRVFEALVDYPCDFTMKIVGANEGGFVQDMLSIVASICDVEAKSIQHAIKNNGKWTSVTVQAPVKSAEQLYAVYEKLDLDPRVKFKF